MTILSNPRHERFAQALAAGKTATEAYGTAGYKGDRTAASRLSTNVNIQGRVAELQGRASSKTEVTIESLISEAEEARQLAMGTEQPAAAISALTAKAKLAGLWVEKRENTNTYVDPDSLTDAELAAIATGSGEQATKSAVDPSKLN